MRNETRLKILKISCIYGGVLSLILVGLYVFSVVVFPGTVRFMSIQIILLLTGIVSVTAFSYMHLNCAEGEPGKFSCPTLSGIIITAICFSSGMIFITPHLLGVFYGDLESVVRMTIFLTPGYVSLILGTLSAYVVLSGSRRSPEGIPRWKVRGLQLSTAILMTGIVVSGISLSAGFIGTTEMRYEITLVTSEETTFFVPLPVDNSSGMVADVVDELRVVEGDATWDIVDTKHGKALEVRTSTGCVLSSEKGCGGMDKVEIVRWLQGSNMSMIHEMHEREYDGWKDYEVWVFSSNADTGVRMSLWMDTGLSNVWGYHTDYDYRDTPLMAGWQTVELERFRICYD